MTTTVSRPVPVPDAKTQPFWDAAARSQLVIERCDDCGLYSNPPPPICPRCHSSKLTFQPVSGRGTIYAVTINHYGAVKGFQNAVPYAVIAVELEEQQGLLFLANLVNAPASAATVGLSVAVTFEPLEGGLKLPQFQPRQA
jgi:uncharacterized OB-fold protein